MHKAFHGSYIYTYYSPATLWNEVSAKPYPSWNVRLNPASPTTSVVDVSGTSIQRTQAVTFEGGDSNNTVKVAVTTPYTIRKTSGTVYTAGQTAIIKTGEAFYIEAPVDHTGTFSPTGLHGEMYTSIDVFFLYFGSSYQRLVDADYAQQPVSLSAAFKAAEQSKPEDSLPEVSTPQEESIPESPSTSYDLNIKKVDAASISTPLRGATFEVYKCAVAGHTQSQHSPSPTSSDSCWVLADTKTTDGSGELIFAGLTAGQYALYEKTPPAGYIKSEKLWLFSVTDPQGVVFADSTITPNALCWYVFTNPQKESSLPLTGGAGLLPITLSSIVLLSAAGIIIFDKYRRKTRNI
jgi:uncharacterized surface anchored protein